MPPPSVNKAAHFGIETQRRCHQKSKTEISVAPQKGRHTKFLPSKCWHCNFGAMYYFHHGVSIGNLISGDFIFITRCSWNTVDVLRHSDVLVNIVKRPILCDREKTINIKFKRSETTW